MYGRYMDLMTRNLPIHGPPWFSASALKLSIKARPLCQVDENPAIHKQTDQNAIVTYIEAVLESDIGGQASGMQCPLASGALACAFRA